MTVLQKSTRRHRLIVAFLSVGSLLAVAACGGFEDQHGGHEGPESQLAEFGIGELAS